MIARPYLSIIFPACNESEKITAAVTDTIDYFCSWPRPLEIIIIENGSDDNTYAVSMDLCFTIARSAVGKNVRIKLECSPPGKGNAVKHGIKVSTGRYILIMDVDLATPLTEASRLLLYIQENDVAIGSRKLPGSVVTGLSNRRKMTSAVFSFLTKFLLPDIKDTQCGFKMIRAAAAKKIEPLLTMGGFTYDVELLYIAKKLGYSIVEVPVRWNHNLNSSVSVPRDSINMANDLLQIKANAVNGKYQV